MVPTVAGTTKEQTRSAGAQTEWPEERFAPTSREESEVVIRLDCVDQAVHITSCWPTWSRRFAKRYGRPMKVSRNREGAVTCAFWSLPLASFRPPVLRRLPSAAQVEAGRRLARTSPEKGRFSAGTLGGEGRFPSDLPR